MEHSIIGYTKRQKSTIYYLVCDDNKRPSTEGQSCCVVFVPVSEHNPSPTDIGKTVNLKLRKIGDEWISSIDFE